MSDDPAIRADAPARVVIEAVEPEIDAGRFAIKRVPGEPVCVSARLFAEGHDRLAAALRYRAPGATAWQEVSMLPGAGDRWLGEFSVAELGRYEYTLEAWVDRFRSWRTALEKKVEAGQAVQSELQEGAAFVEAAAQRAGETDAEGLRRAAAVLSGDGELELRIEVALSAELGEQMARHPDRSAAARYEKTLAVQVERERARSGAWYEFFPRSCAPRPGSHGSFRDCLPRLEYAATLGFDVVYLPPIHPIGSTHRKGPDNTPSSSPDDPGSPWAIGSQEGGHKAVHPALGSLADFDRLVRRARELGLEIALDLAFQCSPDHPYVAKHPEWFYRRPDGSIHYAENPPKKYQDIYPLNFECARWRELWEELKSVVLFWIEHGVSIFRVDNPHTKPFAFWEWLIREIRSDHPDVVFLAEAFTRPTVMQYLAKLGFSQSYSYFTWRNTKSELTDYFTEMLRRPICEYMRPNLFVNTPDILHEYLQTGARAAFQVRLVLAATLAGSYGIYGPPFELCVSDALPGSEEYRDSEKYQIRHWDLERPGHICDTVARVNEIRRECPALTSGEETHFYPVSDEHLIAYGRIARGEGDPVVVVVNLDPHHPHQGWLELPLERLGIEENESFQAHDLLGGGRFLWQGRSNYVSLDPRAIPAHIFRIRRRVRTERDFDYYL